MTLLSLIIYAYMTLAKDSVCTLSNFDSLTRLWIALIMCSHPKAQSVIAERRKYNKFLEAPVGFSYSMYSFFWLFILRFYLQLKNVEISLL